MRGISNKQASYLAALQREVGERYSGAGMTSLQAKREIDRLLELKAKERESAGVA